MLREPFAIPLRDARSPLVLAIDIGTSGLRVFLFDARSDPAGAAAHARLRACMERQRLLEEALAPLMS